MSKAFVDTTVLTDALLKHGEIRDRALSGLSRYDETLLPVYAIKEFKAGPLNNFVWMHNKLAITKSFSAALDALQRMSLTPRRYTTATAIEALKTAAGTVSHDVNNIAGLAAKYGPEAELDSALSDEFRLSIQQAILRAWISRRSLTTRVTNELSCYVEVAPALKKGIFECKPLGCMPVNQCCLADELKASPESLRKLRYATKSIEPQKREHERRAKVLKDLARKPRAPMAEKECRALGDAYFAFFCPSDAEVLTTNLRDHEPLAAALGKKAVDLS